MSTLTPQGVAVLAALADRAFAAERARLGAANRRLAEARAALEAHEAEGARIRAEAGAGARALVAGPAAPAPLPAPLPAFLPAAPGPGTGPATGAGEGIGDGIALGRWAAWHRARTEAHRARIAAAEAALVPLRAAAARAFGRTRAVEHLAALARAEAAQRAERAAERLALAPMAALSGSRPHSREP